MHTNIKPHVYYKNQRTLHVFRPLSLEHPDEAESKKLSAVTLARMEQKKQIQRLLIENNFDKPQTLRSLVKSAEGRRQKVTRVERKTSKLV